LFDNNKASKNLVSTFAKLEDLLGKIGDKATQPPSKGLFSSMEKDLSSAQLLFKNLFRQIDNLENTAEDVKIELFPKEERENIKAVIKGLEQYSEILGEIKKKQSEVTAAQKASSKASKAVAIVEEKKTSLGRKKEKAELERTNKSARLTSLNTDPEKNAV
jgi:hypothetical protein